jgi:hypothetical protein
MEPLPPYFRCKLEEGNLVAMKPIKLSPKWRNKKLVEGIAK